ncbi:hypothetical protein GQ53DRAFT_837255 [Thozetella sp. PMI_491]|nr:hypothetical protein GQ53DRAFT_837255 [Thozetella sp. PMI_491]
MASIVVQPPTQTPSQTYLYPPVVACASLAGAHIDPESITDVFAQIVLVDASGTPHPQLLQGSVVVSACELPDGDLAAAGSSASGTGSALYFLFGDIYITVAGSFTLRVDIQVIDTQGQVILVDQTGTRQVHVFNQDVAFENPSAAELALLDRLSAAGCNVPTVL